MSCLKLSKIVVGKNFCKYLKALVKRPGVCCSHYKRNNLIRHTAFNFVTKQVLNDLSVTNFSPFKMIFCSSGTFSCEHCCSALEWFRTSHLRPLFLKVFACAHKIKLPFLPKRFWNLSTLSVSAPLRHALSVELRLQKCTPSLRFFGRFLWRFFGRFFLTFFFLTFFWTFFGRFCGRFFTRFWTFFGCFFKLFFWDVFHFFPNFRKSLK